MESLIYALLTVFATALLRVTLKHCVVGTDRAWATLIFYYVGASVVLLPFIGIPNLSELTGEQIALLLASGALFSLAAFLDILAIRQIDASSGEIFHTLTFIVSVSAGFVMFNEACSLWKILGSSIICLGIVYEARCASVKASHGCVYKMASAALVAVAIIITKHLTTNTPSGIIILSGFVIPGLVYMALDGGILERSFQRLEKASGS